jgi:hypothetical protein
LHIWIESAFRKTTRPSFSIFINISFNQNAPTIFMYRQFVLFELPLLCSKPSMLVYGQLHQSYWNSSLIAKLLKANQISFTSTQMSWLALFPFSFGVVLF